MQDTVLTELLAIRICEPNRPVETDIADATSFNVSTAANSESAARTCPLKAESMGALMALRISRRSLIAVGGVAIAAPYVLKSALAAPTGLKFALPWIPHGGYAFLFAAKQL